MYVNWYVMYYVIFLILIASDTSSHVTPLDTPQAPKVQAGQVRP